MDRNAYGLSKQLVKRHYAKAWRRPLLRNGFLYKNWSINGSNKHMSVSILLLIVCVAGAVGGIVNALMTDNGFIMPSKAAASSGSILRPGFIGNALIGAVAAGISWGLYGPLSGMFIFGDGATLSKNVAGALGISLASLVGAMLVGVGGARWLTNEVDKNLLKAAASKAASSQADATAAQKIALASPVQALDIAGSMR
jgi:hypothetical protein